MPHHLSSTTQEADRATIRALQELSDYVPVNPAHSTEEAVRLDAETEQAIATVERLKRELAAAQDMAQTYIHRRHDVAVSIRSAVRLQYGPNSWAVKAVGLKKKVDYKRRPRGVVRSVGTGA